MSPSTKKVVLKTAEGEEFDVEEAVALQSETIKLMMEDEDSDSPKSSYPVPNVSSKILTMVIEYCTKHIPVTFNKKEEEAKAAHEKELKAFDDRFGKIEEKEVLFELILAANYLNIKSLLDLTCQYTADTIKEMSVEEVRAFFNIENDFTPEEEAEIRNKYQWAHEKNEDN